MLENPNKYFYAYVTSCDKLRELYTFKMHFTIKQTSYGSERIGTLTGFVKSPGIVIETPTAALITQVNFIFLI